MQHCSHTESGQVPGPLGGNRFVLQVPLKWRPDHCRIDAAPCVSGLMRCTCCDQFRGPWANNREQLKLGFGIQITFNYVVHLIPPPPPSSSRMHRIHRPSSACQIDRSCRVPNSTPNVRFQSATAARPLPPNRLPSGSCGHTLTFASACGSDTVNG